jgi:hypothetical protein
VSTPKNLEHPTKIECCDCAKRPPLPDGVAILDKREFRPRALRKIDPRSLKTHKTQPRCQQDWLAWRNGQRAKIVAARSRKRSGLTEEKRQELLAFQGGGCAGCGRPGGSRGRKALSADHDHDLARDHDHPENVACEDCMRGFLCSQDNRDIIGLLMARPGATTEWAISTLENLAAYLRDPPMRQLQRLGVGGSDIEESA